MSPEAWRKLEDIFNQAVEMPEPERSSFVNEACGDDTELRREVEKLLRSEQAAAEFIESPIWTDSAFLNTSAKKDLSHSLGDAHENNEKDGLIGVQIGHFKLKRGIGRGGMGAVYLAERADGEFQQRVAVKLIKRGMDSDFIIRRFRQERQILASFEHPFIARLLDGGTRPDGTPYFIMEFIEGSTLYDFCDQNRLGLKERLELFRKICSAIGYAHQRKIVHRDIKPSNILVNASGNPKLLDFGIAKILDPNLIHESVNPTASMLRMMTPDYASPEQVQGNEVTPASDIYSLGILLYELISGHKPYNFAGRALHEVTYTVCEGIPPLPSNVLDSEEYLLTRYSRSADSCLSSRSISKSDLSKALAGDLDNIIMKAIAKSPSERYASVEAFSADISNYLSGKSIAAETFEVKQTNEPRSFPVRSRSNARSLAVLPFKFLNLAAEEDTGDKFLGIGLADALIMRLSKVRRLLVRPTSSVLAFGESLTDPIRAGKALSVDFILDGNIKKAANRLRVTVQLLNVAENSAVWATSIDENLSDVLSLEDTLSTKVVEALLPQLTGSELAEFAKRGTEVPEAFEHYIRGRYHFNNFTEDGLAKAFVSFHKAIAADPDYALAYTGLADYYNWLGIIGVLPPNECFQPAIEAATKAVELDALLSEAHATLGFSLHAGNYDWAGGEKHLKRSLEINPANASAHIWYSIVLFTEGRFDEGLRLARQGADLDPLAPFNHHNIGWGLYYARRFAEAEDQYRRVVSEFPDYAFGHYGLSKIYRLTGKTKEAVEESAAAVRLMGDSIFSKTAYAESMAADGQTENALALVKELDELSSSRYVSPYGTALIHCFLSKTDTPNITEHKEAVIDSLSAAVEAKDPWLNWLVVEPAFDVVRDDSRFRSIVERIGYLPIMEGKIFAVSDTDENFIPGSREIEDEAIHDRTTLMIEAGHITAEPVSGQPQSSIRYAAAGIAALLLLSISAGLFHFGLFPFHRFAAPTVKQVGFQSPSVIVLPFECAEPGNANLGVGLADALSQRLGVIKGLQVVSANTARIIAAQDPMQGSREVGATFVLRGTLDRDENGAILRAAFLTSATGFPVWEETFISVDGDYFALQRQVAEKLWESLNLNPLPIERRQVEKSYTQSFAAYEKYLIGRSQMTNRDAAGLRRAISSFAAAVAEDPNFAPAYVGLADSYSLLNLYDITPPPDAYPRAKEHAMRALSIDDELAEAHASLAYIRFFYERDREGAELEFRRSIQMNPSYVQAHHWFALALAAMGKPLDALTEIQTAERLDPRSLSVKSALGMVLFFDRKYDDAMTQADRALAIDPRFVPAHKVKRWIYAATGNLDAARETLERERLYMGGQPDDPGWQVIEAQLAEMPAGRQNALDMLDKAIAAEGVKGNDFAYAFEIALAFNHLCETAKALEWLERSERAGTHSFNLMESDPRLANLHFEPRYHKLLEKLRPAK